MRKPSTWKEAAEVLANLEDAYGDVNGVLQASHTLRTGQKIHRWKDMKEAKVSLSQAVSAKKHGNTPLPSGASLDSIVASLQQQSAVMKSLMSTVDRVSRENEEFSPQTSQLINYVQNDRGGGR